MRGNVGHFTADVERANNLKNERVSTRLLDRVRPNTLAFGTTSMSLPLTTIGSNEAGLVEKVMRSSLHFGSLSSNLFMVARVEKVSTAFWMLLSWPLLTVSETVVSSTYFHRSDPGMSRSLIIIANSHGPSLVPCGTPAGTAPHSEKQSELSFTLCFRSVRKSVIHDKTASGMSYTRNLLTKMRWSMRSKAFLKSKRTALTVAPFPSVALIHE